MRTTLLLCFIVLTGVLRLAAQAPARAIHAYNNALTYQQKHQPLKAEQSMRRAIKEYPAYLEAYSILGKWLFDNHQYQAAAALYLQAEASCKDGARLFGKATTRSMLYGGNYAGALQRIPANTNDSALKVLYRQAQFMQIAMAPTKDTILITQVGIPQRINTANPELFPFIAADGNRIYFTRRVNGMDDDLYYADRDTCGEWLGAKNMGSPLNSSGLESAQALSADRHYLFMMRCDNRSENGWDQGGCDLFMAYTADSIWSVPLSFGATINTPDYEGMPSLSSDNRELFFVSDRPGGYGKMDIWSSRFDHGLWQLPRNLGPNINTAQGETAPFIYADNQTLYFASTGHTGMGGNDLYRSQRIDDTTWGPAVNLGYPINTVYDEVSVNLAAAGDTLYLASDRNGIAGNFDLYQVAVPPALKPHAVGFYNGQVYDSLARTPLSYANIYFTDSASGQEVYQAVSNRGDGSYMIALAAGHTYSLLISRIGYQQMLDTMRCGTGNVQHPITHNFALLPVGYEQPTRDSLVLTIYFKKNITIVNDTDQALITQALQPWLTKTGAAIMVNGYTDNSGTPMLNEQFSALRAKAVANAIKIAGGHEETMQVQGWGEANPRAENDTEENRDKNRRVEIVIRR